MSTLLKWAWTRDGYYRERIDLFRNDSRNRILHLPSAPNAPMVGMISHRLITYIARTPEAIMVGTKDIDQVFLKASELFFVRHAGINFDSAVLVELSHFVMKDAGGSIVHYPVMLFWAYGLMGASTRSEWDTDESYYVDRLIMQTELNHTCDLEE